VRTMAGVCTPVSASAGAALEDSSVKSVCLLVLFKANNNLI